MRYSVLIDGEPGAYGVVIPDLPGCYGMGVTVEGALANVADAFQEWVRFAEGSIPQPRGLDALQSDPDVVEALRSGSMLASIFLVQKPARSVPFEASMDAGLVEAIDAAAERNGISRSAILEVLARRGLRELA